MDIRDGMLILEMLRRIGGSIWKHSKDERIRLDEGRSMIGLYWIWIGISLSFRFHWNVSHVLRLGLAAFLRTVLSDLS
jgi:hypothetical protein